MMDKLTELAEEAGRTHAKWGEVRAQRAERERALQDLRHRAGEAERECDAFSLLPEGDRPDSDTDHPARIAEIDAELGRLERLEIEAEAMKDEAREEHKREVRRQFPGRVAAVQEANINQRENLKEMGRAMVPLYLKFLEVRAVLARADADLAALQGQLGGDRKAKMRQQNEVRSLLDAGLVDASDYEIVGQSVVTMFDWTRLGSSPLEHFWAENGASRLPGSVEHSTPNLSDIIQLQTRRFPRRAS